MKRIWRNGFLVVGLLLLLLPANLWGQELPVIRVAAFNYYPAIFLDTNNKVRGFYVDMLDEIASREQIRFEYVFGSWSEGLERLRAGDVDLVTSAAYTEERATFMDYGQQVLLTVWGELYIPQDSQIIPIRDLQDKSIAVMQGDYNARSFKEHLSKFDVSSQFIEYVDFDEVFGAIKDQQVSAGVVNSVFGDAAATRYQVQPSGIAFNPFDIYFATAKGQHAELLNLLDDYLYAWRNDSTSVYFQSRLAWGAAQEIKTVISAWVIKLAALAAVLLLIGLIFIVLLRHRVHRATHQLKKREIELQTSNDMIHLLLDSTAEAIYGLDPQGVCTFCNAACVRILGYDSTDQIIGRNMHDLIHHSHADGTAMPATECRLLKGLNRQIHCDNEVFWRADGSSFPVEYWSYPIRQKNKTLGMVISFVDITERKQTENALIEQKNAYQSILSATRDGFFVADKHGKILDVNPAYLTFSGYNREELLNMHISDLDAEETPGEVARQINKVMEEGSDLFERRHRRKDGTIWPVEISTTYSILNEGRFFVFVRDITERKRVQEQQLLAHFSIEHTHDSVFWIDAQGLFKFVNAAACQQLGYSRDDLLQLTVEDIAPDCHFGTWSEHFDQLRQNKQLLFETHHLTRDGRTLFVEVSSNYCKHLDREFNFAFVRNVTERKQAQLVLQQKNEELEQFVYSVSHDLKSPLITVKTFVSILRQDLLKGDQPQINDDLNYIDKAAEKMQLLLDALLQYSRIGRINSSSRTVSAGQLVVDCLTAMAGILQQQETQVSTGELTQQLHGDPLYFERIWQNLIENAVKYRGNQAQLHIEIGATQQGQDVVFYVRDNGMGIPPEHSGRIFNLFSQLNPGSEGSGLGLALVKKIVSIYQGRIWVESAGEGQGSCFMFTLPGAIVKSDKAR